MKGIRLLLGLVLLSLAGFAAADSHDNPVAQVIVVQTDSLDAYVAEIAKGQAILKDIGSAATIEAWVAIFAGEDAGLVVVAVEYENIAAFGEDWGRVQQNERFANWLAGLDSIRTIVSRSLYEKIVP